MSVQIHPSSVVDPAARIADGVEIGPFCCIEADVEIGPRTQLLSHVVLANGSRIGADVRIHPGAVIATAPQDLKFEGGTTYAVVGDRTVIREYVTINRGTNATGTTKVGPDCLLMAYVHVAHDCVVGSKVILANTVQVAGHCTIGDWAIVGGVTPVHQFCNIGAHCMIGGGSVVLKDVPPYTLAGRVPVVVEGLNIVGLKRRGFTEDDIQTIDAFYRILYRSGMNVSDALAFYESANPQPVPNIAACIEFIRSSKRGIVRMPN